MKAKKRSGKKRDAAREIRRKSGPEPAKPDATNDFGDRNDYGGLPQRDLKKNLGGCG